MEEDLEAIKLCISDLQFEKVIGVVERCWEAESSSIYKKYCGIRLEWMGRFGDQFSKCIIPSCLHKLRILIVKK